MTRLGPFDGCLDTDLLQRYAAAIREPSREVRAGAVVPPVAVATQIWEAQEAGRALVPERLQEGAVNGVHGEHDVVLHRPITPGEPLRTFVEPHGVRPAGRNTVVTLRFTTLDGDGELLAEQWWSTVYLAVRCESSGEPAPPHGFPEPARTRPVAEYLAEVDDDMARRYAAVSGDWSAHHFDLEAARRSGSDRVFLHGLCTMALCGQAVVELAAGGDAARVRRVAVRFAAPMPLGGQLLVRLYDAGAGGVAFEAEHDGLAVITHGRAECR